MVLDNFRQDLRVGLRVLIKEKSFCALAVFVLALGIAAVTTQFSVVNGVVLRGFSFPNSERLVSVRFIDPTATQPNFFGAPPNQILALDYQELAAHQTSFEHVAAYTNQATVNVTYQGTPQRYTGAYVSENFFRVLGVAPVHGRDFTAADNTPGAEKVAIISHALWQRDFGSDPKAIGAAVRLNGRPATIVGVMPPGFGFPLNEEIWIPIFNEYPPRPRHERGLPGGSPAVMGLLKAGTTMEQAESELTLFAQRLAGEFPDTNKQFNVGQAEPLIRTFTPANIRQLLFLMLGLCVAVLLLACANVMNMQFARATLRAKELAVRSSLGATRGRLVRQMLTESLLLAAIGAVAGVALAYWATDFLIATVRNQQTPIPAHISFAIDGVVLAFVVGSTVVAAVFSGVLPAWMASRANPVEVLKEGGRGNTSRAVGYVTRGLVVLQIFLTCIILIASLLWAQSIVKQQEIDYGYDTHGYMTARMGLMDGDYPNAEARRLFYNRLLRDLRASPEIEHAALSNRTRMAFVATGPAAIEIEGKEYKDDRDRPTVNVEAVSPGYFAAFAMRLIDGRDFTEDDSDAALPVAIVNSGFAKAQFGTDNPIGRRFRTVGNNGRLFGPWRTVVGVVSDVRMLGPFNNPGTEAYGFYIPLYSAPFGPARPPAGPQFATIIVKPRAAAAAPAFANDLRRAVNRVDPNLPLYFIGTPAENLDTFLATNRVIATMFSVFGVVAMLLAAVGLYGVMSFSVNQRTQEFGVRMALGAAPGRIVQMVLSQSGVQLLIGLGLGLGITGALAKVFDAGIRRQLFNTSPFDPATYAAVALLLTLVSFIAVIFPARRATKVDPMVALRAE
ncbi:MAG TPA: ABC transporter permease [Opitutaceae bacterium]|nr:ABC transporter permease [Opitutaceae bacterium]